MESTRKIGLLPNTLIFTINLCDDEGGKETLLWNIPPFQNFQQYLEGAVLDGPSEVPASTIYEAFAVIANIGKSPQDGKYLALVKKHNFKEGSFQWHKYE